VSQFVFVRAVKLVSRQKFSERRRAMADHFAARGQLRNDISSALGAKLKHSGGDNVFGFNIDSFTTYSTRGVAEKVAKKIPFKPRNDSEPVGFAKLKAKYPVLNSGYDGKRISPVVSQTSIHMPSSSSAVNRILPNGIASRE
jgi:hypothetical protein